MIHWATSKTWANLDKPDKLYPNIAVGQPWVNVWNNVAPYRAAFMIQIWFWHEMIKIKHTKHFLTAILNIGDQNFHAKSLALLNYCWKFCFYGMLVYIFVQIYYRLWRFKNNRARECDEPWCGWLSVVHLHSILPMWQL